MKHVNDLIEEAYRLEHRRARDADAGEPRDCSGAPGPNHLIRTAAGRTFPPRFNPHRFSVNDTVIRAQGVDQSGSRSLHTVT